MASVKLQVIMSDEIASAEMVGEGKDGKRFPILLTIGRPYMSHTNPETWSCPVAVHPLYTHVHDIAGADSFQALCLASRMAIGLLEGFVQSGGRLLHDDGSTYDLASFGSSNAGG